LTAQEAKSARLDYSIFNQFSNRGIAMNEKKIETMLNFAVRARKIIFGQDNILVYKKRQYCILYDGSLAENSVKKLTQAANTKSIPIFCLTVPLADLVHRAGVKAVSVTDANLAKEIILNVSPEQ
jgi:ribosomal protein L7Ae-like RNA K-turn-binding protein